MKNTARHKNAPILKRYLLKEPMTARENLRLLHSLKPEEQEEMKFAKSLATCNPEEGHDPPKIIKRGRVRKVTKSVKTRNLHPWRGLDYWNAPIRERIKFRRDCPGSFGYHLKPQILNPEQGC